MTNLPKLKPDKSVYVWLLDPPISNDLDEYLFDDNLVLLKGYVSLNPDDYCDQIKESMRTSLYFNLSSIVGCFKEVHIGICMFC